ncbi:MAG TPA: PKD domain-containing protein, partial [Thermoplasmatales archaeon]|nr:PKD domain-containing protein [Thermoplasmatales archaeon]HEX17343.1 PKD domain-containing protein [Thermoplasmatales archaeon]
NAPPVASIDVAEKGYVGEEIILNASHSYDPDGEIISYRWDLGDGAIAEGEVVTHVYKEAGRYRITLEVMDDGGETDTAEAYIEILQREGSISAGNGLIYGIAVLGLISLILLILLILRRRG